MMELLGRLHPLVVHLPIGFLVLLAALELAACHPRHRHLTAARGFILCLAMPAAAFSALSGWLLSRAGGYDATTLAWHQWLGVVEAAAVVILFILQRMGAGMAYRLVTVANLGLLLVVGHLGGTLTHGKDHLTAPLRNIFGPATGAEPAASEGDPGRQPVYSSAVQPVVNRYCVGCHGREKSKAGLRLDTAEQLFRGGESGTAVVPGSAALSLLIKRVSLPLDDEHHMPPEGKPQPTAGEVALLRWWVDTGAFVEETVATLNPPEAILQTIRAQAANLP